MILAVTGHRPQRTGGYGPAATIRRSRFARQMLEAARPASVITGMALGWDQAVADACIRLGIPFSAYLPGYWQADAWPDAAREVWQRLLGAARTVRICTAGPYAPAAMQVRNMHMVDDCDRLLALWDGSPGGTSNCVDYALRGRAIPKPVDNVWDMWVAGL